MNRRGLARRPVVASVFAVLAGVGAIALSSVAWAGGARSTVAPAGVVAGLSHASAAADLTRDVGASGAPDAVSAQARAPHAIRPHIAQPTCTFNGFADTTSVPNVTGGEAIAVSCTGFQASEPVTLFEASPLSLTDSIDPRYATSWLQEVDQSATELTNADGSGDVNKSFTVPVTFSAQDKSAACPPSVDQVDSGYLRCFIGVVSDDTAAGDLGSLTYAGQQVTAGEPGYDEVASDGGIFSFHQHFYGSAAAEPLAAPVVGMAMDTLTGGYYEVASDGGVFAYHAPFYGSMGGHHLTKPIVGMAFDPDTGGYYLVASDGGIFCFHAPFQGSMGGKPLTKPVVSMTYDPATKGYYEVASDGGIFSFHATFEGSQGGQLLIKPVVGVAYMAGIYQNGTQFNGYYEVASDGGIFSFGVHFQGSEGGAPLVKPVVGIAADSYWAGYWEVASDGGIFSFPPGATFLGSEGGQRLDAPVVGMASNLVT
jgi:hypothetical protein